VKAKEEIEAERILFDTKARSLCTSLDEYYPEEQRRPARFRIYPNMEMKLEGIPSSELFIHDGKCRLYSHSLHTLDCIHTVTRAAKIIEALGLKIQWL
jgi:hypothetical protein